MTPHADDLEFVERIVNGDSEAAELFSSRCQLWTRQLAHMSNLPKQEWGDIANEALLTALDQMRRGLFRRDSSFQTWIEKIIRGKIADYWRVCGSRNGSDAPMSIESALTDDQHKVRRNVSLIQSQVWRKIDSDTRLMMQQALRAMPRQQALVLLLNLCDGYSTVEISQQLDLSQGTAGRKLAEAKRLFRQFFSAAPKINPQRETTQDAAPDAAIEAEPRRSEIDFPCNSILLWPPQPSTGQT